MSDAEEVAFREMFSLILAALVGLAILFLVIALFIGRSQDPYVPPGLTYEEAVAQRLEPSGKVNMGGPQLAESASAPADEGDGGAAASLETGAEVYQAVCASCHATGVAGAPEVGTAAVWQQRVDARGLPTLYDHAINGFNAMPARGGMAALSDDQVQQAVDYMLEESGFEP